MPETVIVNDVSFSVNTKGPFWNRMSSGEWEPETLQCIRLLCSHDTTFLDIGAWIGPTMLYAAALGSRAVGLEPDPRAYAQLVLNVASNPDWASRVQIANVAAGIENGALELHSRVLGNSETSVFKRHARHGSIVECGTSISVQQVDICAFIQKTIDPNAKLVTKIDVEGAEFLFLPKLAAFLAERGGGLLVSTHPQNIVTDGAHCTRVSRLEGKLRIIRALLPFNWFALKSGALVEVEKSSAIARSLAAPDVPDTYICST